MKRQIFEVCARIVDANGAYHVMDGYPKTYDSRGYNNDIDKALNRAKSDALNVASTFTSGAGDTRQLQTVTICTADGTLVERYAFGKIADIEPPTE
ncbi:MAG: hypothetical protein IKF99_17620 [Oscillospiraceae bacterium]|nr:hypothetical protein [Oscillospiraceae bacterium]